MREKEAAERFWRWALAAYGQAPARRSLLRLQDEFGADVPVLLWCLWCGAEGIAIRAETMSQAVSFSTGWARGVVHPLRSLRRVLKTGVENAPSELSEDARRVVADTEQTVERMQMTRLALMTPDSGDGVPIEAAEANINLYAALAGLELLPDECAILLGCVGR